MTSLQNDPRFSRFYSWDILDEVTVVKRTDKSIFESRGAVIPKQTRWFWDINPNEFQNKIPIKLYFRSKNYSAYIHTNVHGLTRIFWFKDLADAIRRAPEKADITERLPLLVFRKKDISAYALELLEGEIFVFEGLEKESILFPSYTEGRRRFVCLSKIERNAKNRQACIEHYGPSCTVCGVNFGQFYGDIGFGFIEVHHIQPLYQYLQERKIDPLKDLTPVCSNCHRMIHRKKNSVILVDELRLRINKDQCVENRF